MWQTDGLSFFVVGRSFCILIHEGKLLDQDSWDSHRLPFFTYGWLCWVFSCSLGSYLLICVIGKLLGLALIINMMIYELSICQLVTWIVAIRCLIRLVKICVWLHKHLIPFLSHPDSTITISLCRLFASTHGLIFNVGWRMLQISLCFFA